MNARILELIKNPDIIQIQDLDLLNAEVKNHPYLQSIRALQLIGNHQFNSDNYQKELSITAAYTTDKKILYQLINKKSFESSLVENTASENVVIEASENIQPEEKIEETVEEKTEEIAPIDVEEVQHQPKEVAKPVFVEGVLNRILFEGEEDFLERETEDIDIESTLESGKLVTRKADKKEIVEEKVEVVSKKKLDETEKSVENESVIAETIINEDKIEEEKEIVEDPSEISFHGSEEFLPEVKIKSTVTEQPKFEAPKPQLSKQDEEMQRLIAEVEAKVKASKKPTIKEAEPIENTDVNFSSTQEFKIEPLKTEDEIAEKPVIEKTESAAIIEQSHDEIIVEKAQEKTVEITESSTLQNTSWKPMSIAAPTPDSLIDKKSLENQVVINESKEEETSSPAETKKAEERPVFNVSFFTPNVSSIESKKAEVEEKIIDEQTEITEESNVPVFINTWQNWLKIERKEAVAELETISKEELKNTVIEKFIEKEPKISKLKEESDFVVKEKGSNISHLMTETLANLYVEQKLYAKAIKAYEVLIGKHPQKEELFNEKIQEIKDLRKNS